MGKQRLYSQMIVYALAFTIFVAALSWVLGVPEENLIVYYGLLGVGPLVCLFSAQRYFHWRRLHKDFVELVEKEPPYTPSDIGNRIALKERVKKAYQRFTLTPFEQDKKIRLERCARAYGFEL
jgi:hypothetical protein